MTHVLIATDLLPIIGVGAFLVFVIFVLGRAAASGQLHVHRRRRNFWHRDDSHLPLYGQTSLLDHFTNHETSSSSDNLAIFSSHNNGSNVGSDWSSGGSFGDGGGGLGSSLGNSFGDSSSSFSDSGGGLGSSLGDSFSDSDGGLGSSLSDSFSDSSSFGDSGSSFDDCSSGGSFDSDN